MVPSPQAPKGEGTACENIITNLLLPPPGTNVFAAELHESGVAGDQDLVFAASMDYSASTNVIPFVTNTSPVPPILQLVAQRMTNGDGAGVTLTNVVSWTQNVGGYNWGLEYATDLLTTNPVWTALPDSSPYTNTVNDRRFFRTRAR
jgi:hypothetical protein